MMVIYLELDCGGSVLMQPLLLGVPYIVIMDFITYPSLLLKQSSSSFSVVYGCGCDDFFGIFLLLEVVVGVDLMVCCSN